MEARPLVAILAGGRASRLGQAKPAAQLAGLPLIAYPLKAACSAGLHAVVVAKRHTPLPALECQVIRDQSAGHHPLRGLLTALSHAARADVHACVVLACDMPFLTGALLSWLASGGPGEPRACGGGPCALVTCAAGHLQPLLARYRTSDRPLLERALQHELSLTEAVRALGPRIAGERELRRFGDPRRLCFSVDTQRDLERARRWL